MNELDDDCDGLTDRVDIDVLSTGSLTGATSSASLGVAQTLAIGDLNNDGVSDIAIGSIGTSTRAGEVHIINGNATVSSSGSISSGALATISGPNNYNALVRMSPRLGDNTDDGTDDLVIAGVDYYSGSSGSVHAALWAGGGTLSGSLDTDDALMTWSGQTYGLGSGIISDADMNGDGAAELLLGYPYGGSTFSGAVSVYDTSSLSAGSYDQDDADWTLEGDQERQLLGTSIASDDLDDDGYSDALVCGRGQWYSTYASYPKAGCWLIMGASAFADDDEITNVAELTIADNDTFTAEFGNRLALGDFDGDDTIDVAIAAAGTSKVHVFLDLASQTGTLAPSDADVLFVGGTAPSYFGQSVKFADLNGDDHDELLVGAPDLNSSPTYATADEKGRVFVFQGASTWSGRYSDNDADWTIFGDVLGDGFGYAITTADFKNDAKLDLAVTAPKRSSGSGRIFFSTIDP